MPGGKNIELTEQNKMIFVNASAIDKMYISVQQQVDAFLEGFHEIIPVEFISFFTANELELQMCGVSEIDVDDWKVLSVSCLPILLLKCCRGVGSCFHMLLDLLWCVQRGLRF